MKHSKNHRYDIPAHKCSYATLVELVRLQEESIGILMELFERYKHTPPDKELPPWPYPVYSLN